MTIGGNAFWASARRGVELLNKKFPEWLHKVELGKLCMGEASMNLIGQLFGTPGKACGALGIRHTDLIYYGFILEEEDEDRCDSPMQFELYRELTEVWAFLIQECREEQAPMNWMPYSARAGVRPAVSAFVN